MKKTLLGVIGTILFVSAGGVLAQQQSQGQTSPNSVEPRVVPRREIPMPVRTPGRLPDRQIDPNELARREHTRQQMQEQIQQRAIRRRQQADQNVAPDANVPPGAKGRHELGGKGTESLKQKPAAAGEQHKQQLMGIEQQMKQEQAKYRERLARLSRVRELAQQQGDSGIVDRVDKLIEKDRQRYEAKTQRMERRKNAITAFLEKAAADKNKGGDDADTNKP
jgi:predicted secreted protein